MVVRRPAGRPCSPRSYPISPPASSVQSRRIAISDHSGFRGMDSLLALLLLECFDTFFDNRHRSFRAALALQLELLSTQLVVGDKKLFDLIEHRRIELLD